MSWNTFIAQHSTSKGPGCTCTGGSVDQGQPGASSGPAHIPSFSLLPTTRHGVLLDRGVRYGPGPRHHMDIYIPEAVAQAKAAQLRTAQQSPGEAAGATGPGAPVVVFVHGGIWASGEPWHYAWLATRLAQAGAVVVCPTYTLYPDALVPQVGGLVNVWGKVARWHVLEVSCVCTTTLTLTLTLTL